MRTLKLAAFVALFALLSYCGKRQATTDKLDEQEVPGVGMAHDSANQKLDSTIKAMDTTVRKP